MYFALFLVAFVACQSVASAAGINGWTYHTTDSSCAATYSDPCGPDYWYKAHGAATCGAQSQSPIDISNVEITNDFTGPVPKALNGGCNTWVQFSTNYTYELAFTDEGFVCNNLQLTYNKQIWSMKQIHFHSPSEHTIAGGYFSAEAHLVHKNSAGNILVLGVLLQVAADNLVPRNNAFLNVLWKNGGSDIFDGITTEVEDSEELLNPYSEILPGKFSYYHYNGSLTTPPCSESVQWFVLDEPVMISSDDLDILRTAIGVFPTNILSEDGNDNRPTLPVNDRTVIYVSGEPAPSSDDDDTKPTERLAIAAIVLAIIAFLFALIALIMATSLYNKHHDVLIERPNKHGMMPVSTNEDHHLQA